MLDTVILQILIDYSAIIDHDKFSPSSRGIFNNPQGFFKCVNNPTQADKKRGIYKPKLTIIKRAKAIYLKAEFSVPKLLFSNNLDEVEETDFDEVISKLQKIIKEMGVMLWSYQIEDAEVISFHPSKNISLSKKYTSSFAIRELAKINLNQKLDLEKVSFRNNGEALQLYANRHSVVLYDKINDLNKPAKRAIDKDQTREQFSLFDYIQKKGQIEILRFEIRLSRRVKMKEVLEKIGYTKNPIFNDIFKKDICQKILKLYWDNFFNKDQFLFSINNNPQKILQIILMKYPRTNIRTAVMLIGLNLLCKDDEGIRGFRSIAKNYRPRFNWIMLNNYLRKFEDEIFTKPAHGFIKDIQRSLDSFEPYKVKTNEKI